MPPAEAVIKVRWRGNKSLISNLGGQPLGLKHKMSACNTYPHTEFRFHFQITYVIAVFGTQTYFSRLFFLIGYFSTLAMDRMFSEIPRQLLEYKDGLEKDYGVEIPSEALNLACDITLRHSNGSFCRLLESVLENVSLVRKHSLFLHVINGWA